MPSRVASMRSGEVNGVGAMGATVSVARLIEAVAAEHPDKTAVVDGEREHSYGTLNQTVTQLATRFCAQQLMGERVALMLPNGLGMLCCYLACFRMGAVATPLNYRYAPPELERALVAAEPKVLVIHQARLDLLARVAPTAVADCQVVVVSGGQDPLAPGLANFASTLGEDTAPTMPDAPPSDSPAAMFFTSGSTGRPKGVVHTQASARAILESTDAALGGIRDSDIIQVAEPLVHVSGFIASLSVLMRCGTVVLLDTYDEARYVATLRRWHPTLICTHNDVFAKLSRWPDIRREDFGALRGVYAGGERVSEELQERFGGLTGLSIQVGWGMTEAIWLTICREPRCGTDECIGRPIDGVALRVTDPDGHELSIGEVGEFRVRGPMVMQGYWRDPEETAKAMEGGWLRTGDSGWRDAGGDYWFSARIKDLIVRNTSKITPGEVEAALNAHDSVAASGVVGVPDREEGQVPVAFVVLVPGHEIDEPELLDFLRSRIAQYKIPARVNFVDSLPLTRSGKLDHLALRTLAERDA